MWEPHEKGRKVISSFSIRNYKSFNPTNAVSVALDTKKRVAFFYGLNGAGKSAIGEVIHLKSEGSDLVAQCSVTSTGTGPFRYLVFNQAFSDKVLGSPDGMPGIFTIGEVDTEALRESQLIQPDYAKLEAELEGIADQNAQLSSQAKRQLDLAQDGVWKAHTAHKDGPFKSFLTGWGRDKSGFFDEVAKISVSPEEELDNLDVLESRLADVSGDSQKKLQLRLDVDPLVAIEAHDIWGQNIVGSSDSRLAGLIEKIGNQDWVGTGRDFVKGTECPFCQQQLPHDFKQELSKLFDGDYKEKIAVLNTLQDEFSRLSGLLDLSISQIVAEPLSSNYPDLGVACAHLQKRLVENQSKIKTKIGKPKDTIELDSIKGLMEKISPLLLALNQDVDSYNQRIEQKDSEKILIKADFWKNLRKDRDGVIEAYRAAIDPVRSSADELRKSYDEKKTELDSMSSRLRELRQPNEGTEKAVDAINSRLKTAGIDGFFVTKKMGGDNLYCLARPTVPVDSAASLSEGEKTLISFLYYMELLNGSHDKDSVAVLEKTVAVIDDPISSMSHNYIYDIATMIHDELIAPAQTSPKVRQVLVLTHNLFFLHEMFKQIRGELSKIGRKCDIFRVVKSGNSVVIPLDPNELINDYDAMWQVLKDARDGIARAMVVPNTMRCILEHFFWFTKRQRDFEAALNEVCNEDGSFIPLSRYLNRGSHRGHINFMDYGQYDVSYYLEKLRAVFEKSGFPEHYSVQMGDLEEEVGV
jgi:wobble nucleotide-excising tRNase